MYTLFTMYAVLVNDVKFWHGRVNTKSDYYKFLPLHLNNGLVVGEYVHLLGLCYFPYVYFLNPTKL